MVDDSAGLTARELLRELYTDMKVVRPAVQALESASLPTRVDALERTQLVREAEARGRKAGFSQLTNSIGLGRSVLIFGSAMAGAFIAIGDLLSKLQH